MASNRPWIEINGVKSTTIAGLLITSVPPVAKPPRRYQLQAVDGLNGDIRTDLGYAAYDRTVGIGLAGTYDEDAIIAFFDQSGTVIFSNEPDKVYTFNGIEGFAMERLARMRQAEIILHVQPFKTDAEETPETLTVGAETETDAAAFLKKTSPASASSASEKLIGGSMIWNQQIQNGDFADGATGWTRINTAQVPTFNAANGILSFAFLAGSSNVNRGFYQNIASIPADHVLIVAMDIRRDGDPFDTLNICFSDTSTVPDTNRKVINYSAQEFERITLLIKTTSAVSKFVIGTRSTTAGLNVAYSIKEVAVYDLTLLFGATIADYINTLEGTERHDGPGVDYFKALMFPPSVFTQYELGQHMGVKATGKIARSADGAVQTAYAFDDSVTLQGVPQIDGGGVVYYDGDTYESNGTVTRKYGVVDLGSLSWSKSTAGNYYATVAGRSYGDTALGISDRYIFVGNDTSANLNANLREKQFGFYKTTTTVVIRDTAYADAAAFKTGVNGVYLIYPLATETTEAAEPFVNPQKVYPGGTEEFTVTPQDGINIPVGQESTYTGSSGTASVTNKGNRPSEPTLTITGSAGAVSVLMDGIQYFVVSFPTTKTITIDTHAQEAFWPDGTYANRAVVGEYSRFRIPPGAHTISVGGSVTAASIEGVSLWT